MSSRSSSPSSSRSPSPSPSMDIDASPSSSQPQSRTRTHRLHDSSASSRSDSLNFLPPPSYVSSRFEPGAALSLEDLAAAKQEGKQLWTIKVPHGVSPARLQGLTLSLPAGAGKDGEGQGPPEALAELKEEEDTFHLVEAGKDATSPAVRVYAPAQGKGRKEGTIAAAPLSIARNFEIVLAPPQPQPTKMDADASAAAAASKVEQSTARTSRSGGSKLRELNGYFHPAGSLYDDDDDDDGAEASPSKSKDKSKSKSKDKSGDSPSKKDKKDKDKSDSSPKEKKRKTTSGEGEDSPSKAKAKARKSKA